MMFRFKITRFRKSTFLLLLLFSVNSFSQICRVSTSGTSTASGAHWNDTLDLVWALADPVSCREIWVKSGTYLPTEIDDRDSSFKVLPGVKLFGGFGGFETQRDQRDFNFNKTTLSGDIGNSHYTGDNSRHVIYLIGTPSDPIDPSTQIDGFTIRDGYSDNGNGGGLVCEASGQNAECSPYLQNLIFRNNNAESGGAVYLFSENGGEVSPVFSYIELIYNNAMSASPKGNGGAIYNFSQSGLIRPILLNVEFRNNTAVTHGGAIANNALHDSTTDITMQSTTFSTNSAKNGGAVHISGGGNNNNIRNNSVTIRNSTFYNNSSQDNGGAIFYDVGSLLVENKMSIDHVTMAENNASISGGSIYAEDLNLSFDNSILWGNQAPSGAQVYTDSAGVSALNSVISGDCSGFNSVGNGSLNCNNIFTSNPNLGALENNQGFTKTMLIGSNGSAFDNGNNSSCLSSDQRGISRPQNGQCDIGAVELLNACRVTTTGTGAANGGDWLSQAMNLQTALATAYCDEVWIKAGTYKPTSGNDRSLSFTIQPGVIVRGGFNGTESNASERDHRVNLVILSGDIGTANDMTDNSYHVVKIDGAQGTPVQPTSTIIEGIEIHDGYASENVFEFPENSGAGLFCDGSGSGSVCSPYLADMKFINNHAIGGSGGGIYNNANDSGKSSPQIVNVTFDGNSAVQGGAMFNGGSNSGISSPAAVNVRFWNNSASASGGAVYNNGYLGGRSESSYFISQFFNNTADYGGAVYNAGQEQGISNPIFNDVEFIQNSAAFHGGAFYSAGWNNGQSKPILNDVSFKLNLALRGGAMYLNDLAGNETAILERVTFDQNVATDGGALYNDGENGFSHPELTNVTFHNNLAFGNGGAVYNNGDNGASSPRISNSTFSGNSAFNGGAIYSSGGSNGLSHHELRHIIMWDNTASNEGDTVYHNLAESSVYDSVIEFGCPNNGTGNTNCNNVITGDPKLLALANNGGATKTMLPDAGSSAIDGGNNLYCPGEDQRGKSRPIGSACDIGSVETDGIPDIIFKDGFE